MQIAFLAVAIAFALFCSRIADAISKPEIDAFLQRLITSNALEIASIVRKRLNIVHPDADTIRLILAANLQAISTLTTNLKGLSQAFVDVDDAAILDAYVSALTNELFLEELKKSAVFENFFKNIYLMPSNTNEDYCNSFYSIFFKGPVNDEIFKVLKQKAFDSLDSLKNYCESALIVNLQSSKNLLKIPCDAAVMLLYLRENMKIVLKFMSIMVEEIFLFRQLTAEEHAEFSECIVKLMNEESVFVCGIYANCSQDSQSKFTKFSNYFKNPTHKNELYPAIFDKSHTNSIVVVLIAMLKEQLLCNNQTPISVILNQCRFLSAKERPNTLNINNFFQQLTRVNFLNFALDVDPSITKPNFSTAQIAAGMVPTKVFHMIGIQQIVQSVNISGSEGSAEFPEGNYLRFKEICALFGNEAANENFVSFLQTTEDLKEICTEAEKIKALHKAKKLDAAAISAFLVRFFITEDVIWRVIVDYLNTIDLSVAQDISNFADFGWVFYQADPLNIFKKFSSVTFMSMSTSFEKFRLGTFTFIRKQKESIKSILLLLKFAPNSVCVKYEWRQVLLQILKFFNSPDFASLVEQHPALDIKSITKNEYYLSPTKASSFDAGSPIFTGIFGPFFDDAHQENSLLGNMIAACYKQMSAAGATPNKESEIVSFFEKFLNTKAFFSEQIRDCMAAAADPFGFYSRISDNALAEVQVKEKFRQLLHKQQSKFYTTTFDAVSLHLKSNRAAVYFVRKVLIAMDGVHSKLFIELFHSPKDASSNWEAMVTDMRKLSSVDDAAAWLFKALVSKPFWDKVVAFDSKNNYLYASIDEFVYSPVEKQCAELNYFNYQQHVIAAATKLNHTEIINGILKVLSEPLVSKSPVKTGKKPLEIFKRSLSEVGKELYPEPFDKLLTKLVVLTNPDGKFVDSCSSTLKNAFTKIHQEIEAAISKSTTTPLTFARKIFELYFEDETLVPDTTFDSVFMGEIATKFSTSEKKWKHLSQFLASLGGNADMQTAEDVIMPIKPHAPGMRFSLKYRVFFVCALLLALGYFCFLAFKK